MRRQAARGPAGQGRRIRRAADAAGGGGAAVGVRGPAAPDRAAGHAAGAGGPAGGDPGAGPGRPVAGPRPGPRRRRQPQDDVVPVGDRRAGPRDRPRLRPGSTRKPEQTAGRAAPVPGAGRPRPAGPARRDQPGRPGLHLRLRLAFAFGAAAGRDGPPGGYGAWRFATGVAGQRDLAFALDPVATGGCDHRFEAAGHDPGRTLRHLAQIRHATCTAPTCRRPSTQADFEHNVPYQAGGRTCLCNGGPKCRHDHRLKQDPRWKVEQITPATFRWTAPSGRSSTTEATRYPI